MSKILMEDKSIVTPGDVLAEGLDFLPAEGTYRDGEKVIAQQVGILNVNKRLIKIIPLNGAYIPKKGDLVIGKITEVGYSNWFVNINYAYDAVISLQEGSKEYIERGADLSSYYGLGDFVMAKITNVTKSKAIDLTMKGPGLRKLNGGKIIEVIPTRIPRIVGRMGSMISMIKQTTGCQIVATQNGRIWISGKDPKMELLATKAIRFIERNVFYSGLTEAVKKFLENGGEEVKNE